MLQSLSFYEASSGSLRSYPRFFLQKRKKICIRGVRRFFSQTLFFFTLFFFFFLKKKNLRIKDFGGEFSEITSTDRKTHQNRSKTTKNMKKSIFVKKKKKSQKDFRLRRANFFPIFFSLLPPKAKSNP